MADETKQLSFFASSDRPPSTTRPRVSLAKLPSSLPELASRLPGSLRFGTMSWTFPGWIGSLYAEGTSESSLRLDGLAAYAAHPLLRTVEIDRTYYGPVSAETFASYAARTPDDFRFVVKAHEDCTVVHFPKHRRYGARAGQRNPRLLDPSYASDCVVGPFVEGLGTKGGVLVFQFSPFRVRSPERFALSLHDFLRRLPVGPTYAVELRNESLLTEAYADVLADAGAIHCHNQWERMPSVLAQRSRLPPGTRRVVLARWLTRSGDSYEEASKRYAPFRHLVEEDEPVRHEIATLLREEIRLDTEGYVLVNNKAEGCAPESVIRLVEAFLGSPRPAR